MPQREQVFTEDGRELRGQQCPPEAAVSPLGGSQGLASGGGGWAHAFTGIAFFAIVMFNCNAFPNTEKLAKGTPKYDRSGSAISPLCSSLPRLIHALVPQHSCKETRERIAGLSSLIPACLRHGLSCWCLLQASWSTSF